MKLGGFLPETVAVAPTSTTVVEVDVRASAKFSLYVENLDGSQTFTGTIQRWQFPGQEPAPSTLGDFVDLAAGAAVMADLDVSCTAFIRLVGTMSGAGGDVSVSGADRR